VTSRVVFRCEYQDSIMRVVVRLTHLLTLFPPWVRILKYGPRTLHHAVCFAASVFNSQGRSRPL
jgi:hypothetical protein